MSKEVILMSDVEGLGIVGDVVSVADGFARNFLLPQNLAAPVTDAAHKMLAAKRAAREAELAQEMEVATKLAAKLKDASVTIPVKTSEEGSLYGSVGVAEIAAAAEQQKLVLTKEMITLDHAIKELGVYDLKIKLHPQVKASLKVWIVEE